MIQEGYQMHFETIVLNKERNVSLTVFLQEVGGEFTYIARRPAVLILPGGAYSFCSDREAEPVAFPYLKAGYHVFILRYSLGKDAAWPNPLDDYEQAMSLIRSKADEWNLYSDKIAVIGFSAGGHLACAAATMAENRPNAAILGYAVAGADVRGCCPTAPDTVAAVDGNTCPCFLFATRTDNVVHISNTIQFLEKLTEYDIAFESHIYAYGPHGFSTGDISVQHPDTEICSRVPDWVEDSIGWLGDVLGEFSDEGMAPPACRWHVTDDYSPFLSIDCTVRCIMGNPQGRRLMEDLIAEVKKKNPQAETPLSMDEAFDIVSKLRLRDCLDYFGMPAEMAQQIDGSLKKIPNKEVDQGWRTK